MLVNSQRFVGLNDVEPQETRRGVLDDRGGGAARGLSAVDWPNDLDLRSGMVARMGVACVLASLRPDHLGLQRRSRAT